MESQGRQGGCVTRKVDVHDLLRRHEPGDLAKLLHAYFSGSSFANLPVLFPQFGVGPAELCRWVHSLVDALYAYVDENFVDGRVFGTPLVNISTSLETDEKEISTMPDGNVPIYKNAKLKHGRRINSAQVASFYEQGVGRFCVLRDVAGTLSKGDMARLRQKLKHRLGDNITRLQHDQHASDTGPDDEILGKGVGEALPHIGKHISPVKISEAGNKHLNRFDSVQSVSMLYGGWLFYNWGQPFQDNQHPELTGLVRFEIATGRRLETPGIEWLLRKLVGALDEGWTGHIGAGGNDDGGGSPWPCMNGILSKRHADVFTELPGGKVFCIACGRDLVPPETPVKHRHEYRSHDPGRVVDVSQVREMSRLALSKMKQSSARYPEREQAYEALASINQNPGMAVFAWCSRVEEGCPWFSVVFRDTRNAKKYLRWLRRHQRARRAGPAGMAKLRNAFPGVKTDLWLISPYAREKVTPKEARGFWKNCEDIVKYSRYRRVKRLAKEKAQAGIGKFSGSLAGLGDWLKGQSGKL